MKANPDYFDPIYIFEEKTDSLFPLEWSEYHWTKEEAIERAERRDDVLRVYEKSMYTGNKKIIWEK